MKYFQSDDIPADTPKKDCIHTYYRVYAFIEKTLIKEGRHAVQQTHHLRDRVIYKRRWNESKRTWKDSEWILTTKT